MRRTRCGHGGRDTWEGGRKAGNAIREWETEVSVGTDGAFTLGQVKLHVELTTLEESHFIMSHREESDVVDSNCRDLVKGRSGDGFIKVVLVGQKAEGCSIIRA